MRKTTLVTTAAAALIGLPFWALAASDEKGKEEKAPTPRKLEKIESKGAAGAESDEPESPKKLEKRTYLGVAVEPVPEALVAHLPEVLSSGQGLLVTQVMAESPAAKAGLKVHDVLVTYDDQKLLSADQLVRLVHGDKPSHQIVLGVVRAGKLEKVRVTLGERESAVPDAKGPLRGRIRPPFGSLPFRLGDGPDDKGVPGGRQAKTGMHSRFLSMSLRSIDGDRFKAEVEYKDEKGEVHKWSLEGTREEIRKELEADKDLPAEIREQLLRSLNFPGGPAGRLGGFRSMMPHGGGIFFGGDEDGANWFSVPGASSMDEWLDQLFKGLDWQVRDQIKGTFRSLEPSTKKPPMHDRSF